MQQTQSKTSTIDLVKIHKLLASVVLPEQITLYEQEKAKFLLLSNKEVTEMIQKNSSEFDTKIDTAIAIAVSSVDKEELKQKVLTSSANFKQGILASYAKISQEIIALEGNERFDKYVAYLKLKSYEEKSLNSPNAISLLYKTQISNGFQVVEKNQNFWEKLKKGIFGFKHPAYA